MTELLKRWAELEPQRCRFAVGHSDLVFVGPERGVLGETVTLFRLTEPLRNGGLLLAATIEATEARGWDCRLTSNQLREGDWHAVVWVGGRLPRFRQPRPSLDGFGPTPAVALLGAYLAALATEGQS